MVIMQGPSVVEGYLLRLCDLSEASRLFIEEERGST